MAVGDMMKSSLCWLKTGDDGHACLLPATHTLIRRDGAKVNACRLHACIFTLANMSERPSEWVVTLKRGRKPNVNVDYGARAGETYADNST